MKNIIAALSAFLLLQISSSFAEVVIVASAKSPATALTQEQADGLFLGKSSNLPGAGIPLLIDQPESAPLRVEFYTKLSSKSVTQVKGIWMRLVFSGKGVPPTEVPDSDAVKKLLASNPNAVGYIEKSALDASVKVLLELK